MIRIAIVEDKPPILRGLQNALAQFEELELAFIAINGVQAVQRMAEPHPPEVILMDIEMPRMNGIEATRSILAAYPNIAIVMLTVFDDEEHIFEAMLSGASGYLLKEERPEKILRAIQDAQEGRMPMSPMIARRALGYLRHQLPAKPKKVELLSDYTLTERETEVLEGLAQGLTYPQLAEKLFISRDTVRNHVTKVYKKLKVKSKVEVIRKAQHNRWFR